MALSLTRLCASIRGNGPLGARISSSNRASVTDDLGKEVRTALCWGQAASGHVCISSQEVRKDLVCPEWFICSVGLINEAGFSFSSATCSRSNRDRARALFCLSCGTSFCCTLAPVPSSQLNKGKVAAPRGKISSLETLLVIFQKGANLSWLYFSEITF